MSTIMYGPESEVYNTYSVVSPAPPAAVAGGAIAYRHRHPLGKQLVLDDMRKFRFGAAFTATLVKGNVVSASVSTASQQSLAPQTAAVVGDRSLIVTTGASSAINVFAEGYAIATIFTANVAGSCYRIAGHALMTSGTDTVHLAPGHSVREALTTATSKVDLIDNPFFALVQVPATTAANAIMGVAVSAPTSRQACWIQTRGMASVLGLTGTIAGTRATAPGGTAGTCIPETAAGAEQLETTIGISVHAHAATQGQVVFLTLDG